MGFSPVGVCSSRPGGFGPAPTSRTVAMHVTFFWPTSLAKDGPSEHIQFRKNMQKFIGRSLLPTAVRTTEVDIPGCAGERHWHKGCTSMHQTPSRNCLAKSLCKAECWLTYLPAGNLHSLVWYVTTLYFPLSAFPLVTHHLCTSDGEGSPSPRQMGRAPHVRLRWGGLPIWAPDGECSLSDLQMGRAPYPGLKWGELPIRPSDGESSLSGLQMGRAPYPGSRLGGLSILAVDGESSLSGLRMGSAPYRTVPLMVLLPHSRSHFIFSVCRVED
jgi:hypothetical protein